jgi:hypothetical protein
MATFREANQIRVGLKMKLSNYYWYNSSCVLFDKDDYYIVVHVKRLDNQIRKIIPPVSEGISIITDVDKSS